MNSIRLMALALLLPLAWGCSNTRTETYNVTVHNSLDKPIMVFLTKNGPPLQDGWWSPEDIAVLYGNVEDDVSRWVVRPGGQANSGPMKALLAPGARAVLRVYEGRYALAELIAINRGSPDRLDLILTPGSTDVTVSKREGALVVSGRDD